MQAHSQSPTAARKHPPDPWPAKRSGGQAPELPVHPVTANARRSNGPSPQIAANSGLAHDAAPPTLPGVHFPAETLERILVNLVRNAAQAIERSRTRSQRDSRATLIPATGTIRIVLANSTEGLHLTVEDDGPGIPMLDAAAFLAPSPLPPGARQGLGHHVIFELVTATKGTLTVNVRPGRGTQFVILWPAGTGTSGTPASPSTTGPSEVRAC